MGICFQKKLSNNEGDISLECMYMNDATLWLQRCLVERMLCSTNNLCTLVHDTRNNANHCFVIPIFFLDEYYMHVLVSSCSCLSPIHWGQVLSRQRRCSWSSADRRCSNNIWVINNFIAYWGVAYIRGLTVLWCKLHLLRVCLQLLRSAFGVNNIKSFLDIKGLFVCLHTGVIFFHSTFISNVSSCTK